MNETLALYPPGPVGVAPDITAPSPEFKSEVKKVMGVITLFFIVYITLVTASIALAAGCVVVGIAVIAGMASLLGLMFGLGIISIGIMVFIFLIKFIFSVKKFDESGSIEVTEEGQPQLFSFIRRLTDDTQTQFPKKIILSPEVNACVFYNDSFWSMFFPVRKNLQIGLGLVNSLTVSEFKAVMAHEFGHFSQRSMKLGTFVYNVNKAIYNMLYENKDYGQFLQKWGSVHWAIGIFMWVTIQIVKGIQQILQGMYSLINKNYMSLSREMEFHADGVAASVSGSENLIRALRKVEVSDVCYNMVIQKANDYIDDKTVFENLYSNQYVVMEQYAKDNNLQLQHHVPVPDNSFFKRFQLSRVNISNQWASHPGREDREKRLYGLNVAAPEDAQPAWLLFNDAAGLQKQLTAALYRNVADDIKKQSINEIEFRQRYLAEVGVYTLPEAYNGYYDGRAINDMEVENVLATSFAGEVSQAVFKQLTADEQVALLKRHAADQEDAELLKKIANKEINVKTFDFDGEKHDRNMAPTILETLTREIEQQKQDVQKNEEAIVTFFYKAALQKGAAEGALLRSQYVNYFTNRKSIEKQYEICQRIMTLLAPVSHGHSVTLEQASKMAAGLRGESETLKTILKQWLQKDAFDNNTQLKSKIESFIKAQYQYFSGNEFFNNELGDLHHIVINGIQELNNYQWRNFKKILEYQLTLI